MIILRPIINYKKTKDEFFSDIVDWYGGFPYEFATFDYLVDYIENQGFNLKE